MKKLIGYLLTYVKEHFNWKLYVSFLAFIAISVYLNYDKELWGNQSLRNYLLSDYFGKPGIIPGYTLFQLVPYLFTLLLISIFTKNRDFWRKPGFWVMLCFGFALVGVRCGMYWHRSLLQGMHWQIDDFYGKIYYNAATTLVVIVPLLVFYFTYWRKKDGHFFGLRTKEVNFKPYFIMFFIMLPLVTAASFFDSFLDMYPTYKRAHGDQFASYYGVDEWIAKVFYEVVYLADFTTVEILYRGFLVYCLVKYLGKDVVLPMAATYVYLHFGKPLGETIGSLFGGYILGILSYYSRNIWGGVFIHMGVAFLMEITAMMQLSFKD